MHPKRPLHFRTEQFRFSSFFFTGLTGLATFIILAMLAVILLNVIVNGWRGLSWRFISTIPQKDFFKPENAAVLPMIIGTTLRVLLMTIFVIPVGVITAVYLTEYARNTSPVTRFIRGAVNNLAGVPSIVFGLFGVGFFINFIGRNLDRLWHSSGSNWSQPSILWASLTLAVMTLPVVIVATEESLRAMFALHATTTDPLTDGVETQYGYGWSIATLGGHRLNFHTGGILAVSRAAGEVAPILFTGVAYYMASLPKSLTDQFMDLGYHVYVLSTQSPNIEETRPILYATVLVLLLLTLALNLVAILVRANMRKRLRALH